MAGTEATPVALPLSVTTKPPTGAAPFNFTYPEPLAPPTTGLGERLTSVGTGANTVRVPVLVTPPAAAEIVTVRLVPTGVVVMMKDGDCVCPAATVTVAGKVTLGSLLESVTTTPPVGARWESVTVF